MAFSDLPPEDLRQRAQTFRDLAEIWPILLTMLAEELEKLAVEKEKPADAPGEVVLS